MARSARAHAGVCVCVCVQGGGVPLRMVHMHGEGEKNLHPWHSGPRPFDVAARPCNRGPAQFCAVRNTLGNAS